MMIALVGGYRALASPPFVAAAAIAATVLFYEGLPLGPLRLLPVLGPGLENIVDGRVDRVRRAGTERERARWEEARRQLLARMAEERRAAETAIRAIEREYLEARDQDAERIRSLEKAITEQEKADAEASRDACVVRPFIGRSLRDHLDGIGR